jgi:hypothetical protein
MIRHAIGITAAVAFILLITLLPFLPGEHEPLALALSAMARVFGLLGLAVVPVSFTRAGRLVLATVTALVVFVAFPAGGIAFGVMWLLIWALVVFRLRPRVPSIYMLVVPLAVFPLQWMLVGRAAEFARNRAIANAGALIADIEAYRAARGKYPESLLSNHRDYKPSIIGVDRYLYEPKGHAYNIVFKMPSASFINEEYVAYNPRDEQHVNAHPMDILQFTPEHLERTRGFHASGALRQPHWKYFWFD